jgi:hypothetical protein
VSPRVLTLTVPMPPNIANGRGHWRVKENRRRTYFDTLDYLLAAKQLPRPPAQPLARATIRAAMVLGAHMDDDNALARLKWPTDWLVRRGYVADDRRACLTWEGLPAQRVTRKEASAVTFTLTEAA